MNKIFVVTGNYNSIDYQYDWNFRAFTDRERAVECRNQLEDEVVKFKNNPPEGIQEWSHPLDHNFTLWSGIAGPTPEITYSVEVVDLDSNVC